MMLIFYFYQCDHHDFVTCRIVFRRLYPYLRFYQELKYALRRFLVHFYLLFHVLLATSSDIFFNLQVSHLLSAVFPVQLEAYGQLRNCIILLTFRSKKCTPFSCSRF